MADFLLEIGCEEIRARMVEGATKHFATRVAGVLEGKPERFVRPVRWIVAMLDGEVVPLEFAGVKATAETCGHRVLGSWAVLRAAKDYASTLQQEKVIVDPKMREERIRKALDAAARTAPNVRWREDPELLKTV